MKSRLIKKIAFCSDCKIDYKKLESMTEERLKELCKFVVRNNREWAEVSNYVAD